MSATSVALLLLLALAGATVAASTDAPEEASRLKHFKCKLDDSVCLKNYLQNDIIGTFSSGSSQFGETVDPLNYKKLSFTYEPVIGIKVTVTHTDSILYGLAKTKVLDVRTSVSDSEYTIEAQVSTSKLLYEGSYTFVGEVMAYPVDWEGKFNISVGDVEYTWKLSADIVKRGTDTYLDLQDISFSPQVGSYKVWASGLFGDFSEIGDFTLALSNRFWRTIFHVMWRLVEPKVISTAAGETRAFFSKTPITGMVPV